MTIENHPVGEIAGIEVFANIEVTSSNDSFDYSYGSINATEIVDNKSFEIKDIWIEFGERVEKIQVSANAMACMENYLIDSNYFWDSINY